MPHGDQLAIVFGLEFRDGGQDLLPYGVARRQLFEGHEAGFGGRGRLDTHPVTGLEGLNRCFGEVLEFAPLGPVVR